MNRVVEEASFEKIECMERENAYSRYSLRTESLPGEESFKVRCRKIGGYSNYLEPMEVHRVDRIVCDELSPLFGYNCTRDTYCGEHKSY
jgi:hypothetical protein